MRKKLFTYLSFWVLLITSVSVWGQIALPYTENFSTITVANGFPTVAGGAWTRSGTTTLQPTYITNQASYNRSGNGDTKFITFRYGNSSGNYYFVGPFSFTAGVSYTASVLYKADGLSGFGPLALTYGTTAAAASQTNTIVSVSANITNLAFQTLSGNFTPATTGSYYLAIKCTSNSTPWYLTLDDFDCRVTPSCMPPTGLTVSSVTSTSATVSWTAPSTGVPSGYNWKIVTAGAGSGGAAVASGNTTVPTVSASATGLTANTSYDLWVQTDCGASGTSTWAGPTNFYTGYCIPTTTTSGDYISAFSTTGGTTNVSTSGTSTAALEDYTAQTVTSYSGGTVNFTGSYVGGSAGLAIWIDWGNDLVFDASDRVYVTTATAASWSSSFSVPAGQANGTYRMRIRAQWGAATPPACGAIGYGQAEDYTFVVAAAPACSPPTALTVTPTSATAADVSWTCTGCTGTYIIEYGAAGFTPGTGATAGTGGTLVSPATSPVTLSGLSSTAVTDVYVRQDCGGVYSNNSTVAKFLPGDVCANAIDLGALTSPFSGTTVGYGDNISICRTGYSDRVFYIDVPNGYSLSIGESSNGYDEYEYVGYGATCPGTTTINCYDNDALAQTNWTNSTGATQRVWWVQDAFSGSGTFTLQWSLTAPPACGNITLGTTTGITHNAATLNWTAGAPTPTDFEIEYGVSPYTFTGTPTITTTAGALTQLLSSLTANTTYQFKIRSICAGPAMGNWSTTGSFTTLVAPPANDLCADAIVLTGCSGGTQTLSGTTLNATGEAGYVSCGAGGTAPQTGVWYKYVGDNNSVTITTCNATGFDTRLTVYSGSCAALTCVGGNDDDASCTASTVRSTVTFNAYSGTDYYVYVHGYSGTGNFILTWNCTPLCLPVPANETCASAQAVSLTTSYAATAATNNCSSDDNATNPSCFSSFATLPDLWYSFTTPAGTTAVNLRIDLTAGTGNATSMGYALYSGTCGALTQVACNSGATSGATNTLTGLTPSTTYYLALLSPQSNRGAFTYGLWYETCPQPTVLGVNTMTSTTANLTWNSNAASSNFDIYYGISPLTAPTGSTTPTVNDYNGGAATAVSYPASGLTHTSTYQYYVREDCGGGDVSAWSGPYSFTTPMLNDVICGALPVVSSGQTSLNTYGFMAGMSCNNQSANNSSATADAVGATCGGSGGKSVWYTFTTPSCVVGTTVPFQIELSTDNMGTNFDTKLALFTSSDNTCSGSFTQVICDDDGGGSSTVCGGSGLSSSSTVLQSTLLPNKKYWVLVDGYGGATGNYTLSGRVLTAPHTVTTINNNTGLSVTAPSVGATAYTYYAQRVGTTGYSVGTQTTNVGNFTLPQGNSYRTQVLYRCGTTSDQTQFYRTEPQITALPSTCPTVTDLTCTYNGDSSYTLTWTAPSGTLYTNNGALSGYILYYQVVGSSGYSFGSNPQPTCTGGMCSITVRNLRGSGYNFWIKTRCSATVQNQSNITTCSNVAPRLADGSSYGKYSFKNPLTGFEFVDVTMYDDYSDFGLDIPMFGNYDIFVNNKNEITYKRTDFTSSEQGEIALDFIVAPNPSSTSTNLYFNNTIESGLYTVVDMMGRTVQVGEITKTDRINVDGANLQAGVYMIVVNTTGMKAAKQFVLTK